MSTNRPSTHAKIFFGLLAALFAALVWWGIAGGTGTPRAQAASAYSCEDAASYAALIRRPGGVSFLMSAKLYLDQAQREELDRLLSKIEVLSPNIDRLCRAMETASSSNDVGQALDSFENSLDLTMSLTAALRPELEAFFGSLSEVQKCILDDMTKRSRSRRQQASAQACAAIG